MALATVFGCGSQPNETIKASAETPDGRAAVGDPPDGALLDGDTRDAPGEAFCTGPSSPASLEVAAAFPWPGGGLQALLAPSSEDVVDASPGLVDASFGDASDASAGHASFGDTSFGFADATVNIAACGPAGSPLRVAISRAPEPEGITVIAVVPHSDASIHAERIAAARAIVDGMPAGERIGVWLAGAAPSYISDLTSNRAHLHEQLASAPPQEGIDIEPHLAQLRVSVAGGGGSQVSAARSLIAIGAAPAVDGGSGSHPTVDGWSLGESASVPSTATRFVGWGSDRTPEQAGRYVVDAIQRRRASLVRVGVCADGVALDGTVVLQFGKERVSVPVPTPLAHTIQEHCDPVAAAEDRYPYPRSVELALTASQKAVYDGLYAAKSKDDFELSVHLDTATAIPAKAHFRGQTSMDCARKNYAIDLAGSSERRLAPGARSDAFYLISMCADDGYFKQAFADRLLRRLGLTPLEFHYVKVRRDGVNQGVYLLVADPEHVLREDHLALEGIIRRRLDPDHIPEEVKLPNDADRAAAVLSEYSSLAGLIDTTNPTDLYAALAARMDIEAYVRWLAFNSVMRCGDYVDEIEFYGSLERLTEEYFRIMVWDPKDIFAACHHFGQWALPDSWGMLYCAEGNLDRALAVSPEVYRRFVGEMESVLSLLSEPLLATTMDEVRQELWASLDDDETAAAMIELAAADPTATTVAGARAAIQTRMDALLANAALRRTELLDRVAAYRSANP